MAAKKFKINDIHIRSKGGTGMSVRSETITVTIDPDELGDPVAKAIRVVIRDAIKAIQETAQPSTLARSARSTKDGRQRRTPRLFNATGKLVDELGLRRDSEGKWSIGAPRERLEGHTDRLLERLVDLVPVLKRPLMIFRDPRVRAAQVKSAGSMFKKARLR